MEAVHVLLAAVAANNGLAGPKRSLDIALERRRLLAPHAPRVTGLQGVCTHSLKRPQNAAMVGVNGVSFAWKIMDPEADLAVNQLPWFMAKAPLLPPLWLLLLYLASGSWLIASVLGVGLSAAHIFAARKGFLSRPSYLGAVLTHDGIRLAEVPAIECRQIVACFASCRLHQEVIGCGDLHIVTGNGDALIIHDVCDVTAFLEYGFFQYRSMWAGVAVRGGVGRRRAGAANN